MNALADFHFLHPAWLSGLLPLAWICWKLYRQKRRHGEWAARCDSWLLAHILIEKPGRSASHRLSLLALSGLLALLALADPVWQREPTPGFRNERALVIALSLSATMDAADVKPSRLERARYKIADLLQARKDGQTALVAYAGDAFTVTPLTDDQETIRAQLAALSTDTLPTAGNRPDLALQQAEHLLNQAGMQEGHVLLIGDAAATAAERAAERLRGHGYRVSVLASGTAQGAPIAQAEGGFLKDDDGNIIVAKLDAPALQAVATAGGGRYLPLSADNGDVQTLTRIFERNLANPMKLSEQTRLEHWRETGPWLLLPLLPLAAMAFRRGLIPGIALLVFIPWPSPAAAWEWRDLWQNRNQQAQQLMQQQDYPAAAERFQDPAWKGAALYRAGQYPQAAEALAGLDDAESQYNRGNALAQAGRYPEAIAAYEQALKRNPDLADARHNKELLEKLAKEQPKNNQNSQDRNNSEQRPDNQDKSNKNDGDKNQGQTPKDAKKPGQDKPNKTDKTDKKNQPAAQDKSGDKPDPQAQTTAQPQPAHDETAQANEAWLKRIPDDPGGLLKRKFQRQHQQRRQEP